MTRWGRTADGWAMNLDGSDAALVFSLPRVELRSSFAGWRGLCFLADGSCREWPCVAAGSLLETKARAVEQARGFVGGSRGGA